MRYNPITVKTSVYRNVTKDLNLCSLSNRRYEIGTWNVRSIYLKETGCEVWTRFIWPW